MTVLLLSQVYPPDPAAVGQYMADAARELVHRGHRVIVLTGREGYDDPRLRFPRRELRDGVEVRRLPFTSFGKSSVALRMLGALSFGLQAVAWGLLTRGLSAVLFSTTPVMVGVVGAWIARIRRVPATYWVMDLNPDQLVALGKAARRSFVVRVLDRANRYALRHSALVVALDRFMAERLEGKGVPHARIRIIPPWPLEDVLDSAGREANPFAHEHAIGDRFVVMYSGNHTASNPLDTLLEAILAFRDRSDVLFMFVGGGTEKERVRGYVDAHGLHNVLLLPYQPLDAIRYSLSAADLHVVTMGDTMVGVIHPSKVYSAMAVGRPLLYVGPAPSHVADLLGEAAFGWRVEHGDVAGAISALEEAIGDPQATRHRGERGARLLPRLSQRELCGRLCDLLESTLRN